MSAVLTPHDKRSRDLALAAIEEALGSIGGADQEILQSEQTKKKRDEKHHHSDIRVREPVTNLLRVKLAPRRLGGLLVLICVGAALLAWQSGGGQVASEPISTSSLSMTKKAELLAQSVSHNSDVVSKTDSGPQVQAPPQGVPTAPTSAPAAAELTHQIQDIARELATVAQGIDQLKTEQSQIAHQDAELANGLKTADTAARHNAELTEELRGAQSQLAREISTLADQLKANQDLMTNIASQLKDTQDQVARLAISAQRQRPKPMAVSQPTAANPSRSAMPKLPPPRGVQGQDQRRLQPNQQ
ncbi:hypothetical protein [Bradyrhizobium sp.]|uniref:hypothetical protein n=1 Tax=Bradyrhizobium sp. TaxID=376 RepID=UPI003C3F4011